MQECSIDPVARDYIRRFGIPDNLLVPVAAADEDAISQHVGEIVRVLSAGTPARALLVNATVLPEVDERLPIWALDGAGILRNPVQIWVHVAFTRYRRAYRLGLPLEDISGRVLSHAENRRSAALKGFQYARLTPVSRGANSSSAFAEGWGVALHSTPDQMAANLKRGARIQYADLTGLMLMLDLKLGGGVMDAVNEGRKLIRPALVAS